MASTPLFQNAHQEGRAQPFGAILRTNTTSKGISGPWVLPKGEDMTRNLKAKITQGTWTTPFESPLLRSVQGASCPSRTPSNSLRLRRKHAYHRSKTHEQAKTSASQSTNGKSSADQGTQGKAILPVFSLAGNLYSRKDVIFRHTVHAYGQLRERHRAVVVHMAHDAYHNSRKLLESERLRQHDLFPHLAELANSDRPARTDVRCFAGLLNLSLPCGRRRARRTWRPKPGRPCR
jgi:hypothetical protein